MCFGGFGVFGYDVMYGEVEGEVVVMMGEFDMSLVLRGGIC